jgi:guanylate kinase
METLFIIFGRSAVGKTTIARKLQKKYGDRIHEAVSVTTRNARPGEEPGVDYHFISKEEFEKLIEEDGLAEKIEYNGNYYGLAYSAFDTNKVNIAIIEPNGLKQVKEKMKDKFKIIVVKIEENDDTIAQRLVNRGDAPEVREKRIHGDKTHFANVPFDYLINSRFEILDWIIKDNSSLGHE